MPARRLFPLPVVALALTVACTERAEAPMPTDPPLAFHVTDQVHLDMVRQGNPYPNTGLLWVIGGIAQNVPNVSRAANGHSIDIRGLGPFTTQPGATVGGAGTFTWWDASGTEVASGTWVPTRLISYTTYKVEVFIPASPFGPLYLIGGLMIMEVRLSTGHIGILRVDCLIGDHPPAAAEGMELALRGGPNFHTEVPPGGTVFVRFAS